MISDFRRLLFVLVLHVVRLDRGGDDMTCMSADQNRSKFEIGSDCLVELEGDPPIRPQLSL